MQKNSKIKLIFGLGNPGPSYIKHRHNVGVWFIEQILQDHNASLKSSSKLKAKYTKLSSLADTIWAVPEVFMNNSGDAVQALLSYFKLDLDNLLVIHDDLDLEPGIIKLKFAGGHGGHNGLRDIMRAVGGKQDFWRLRIGIGHPGHKSQVHSFVLSNPNKTDLELIESSIWRGQRELNNILAGNYEQVMQNLHSQN